MLDITLDAVITLALAEDLSAGDLTTEACVPESAQSVAHAVARHGLVVCGGRVFQRVFERIDSRVKVTMSLGDGERAETKTRLWTAVGPARAILMGERTALNLVQRMCGIASMTRSYVDALPTGCKTRIADTRKTTPGLRALERYAVRTGGGHNHRDNLGSAVLIKDNHIVAAGGVKEAIFRARARAPHTSKIECEVDSLEQLDVALDAGADVILLDNMSTDLVRQAVARTRGRAVLEASGGITKERIRELAEAGVDVISSGALTHSVIASDIGLDFES